MTTPPRIPALTFLDEKEVAELLGVSVASLRRWRLLGRGPRATKIGASVRYKLADIEAFVNQCPTIGGRHSGQ